MKWVAISGTWRTLHPDMERDVQEAVRTLYERGDNLVVGAALGVDSMAIRAMCELDRNAERIHIILPTTLFAYVGRLLAFAAHQDEAVATAVNEHIDLLDAVKAASPHALEEGEFIDPAHLKELDYLAMNTKIVAYADELIAFQVNQSSGTQDAIDKARQKGILVTVHPYTV